MGHYLGENTKKIATDNGVDMQIDIRMRVTHVNKTQLYM